MRSMMHYFKLPLTSLLFLVGLNYFNLAFANEHVVFNARGIELQILDNPNTEALINLALALQGTPYKFGGSEPDSGFDCSGFVQYVYQKAANVTLPRTAYSMSQIGVALSLDDIVAGDLIFFNTLNKQFSHVGIYLGNNEFIHAPRSGRVVSIENIKQSYWEKRFNGVRRPNTFNYANRALK